MEGAARAVATTLGIRLEVLRVEVAPWSEANARDTRYQALLGALSEGEWLLTAHTADDQAETVLANILRGTGLEGLAGIPSRRPPLARPLLGLARSQTREVATLAGLAWVDDPSNDDLDPLRNRLRRRLIPQLEAEYNPGLRHHLVDLAAAAASLTTLDVVAPRVNGPVTRLPLPMLEAVDRQVAVRSIREALRPLRGGYSPSRAELDRIRTVMTGEAGACQLEGGIGVSREGPWLVIVRGEDTNR
jgi:hypothetical protein